MKQQLNKILYRNRFSNAEIKHLLSKGMYVDGDRRVARYHYPGIEPETVCHKQRGRLVWSDE